MSRPPKVSPTATTLLLLLLSLPVAAQGRPPLAAFANLPDITDMTLSPSGKHIAFFMNTQGTTLLATRDTEGGKIHGIVKTDNERFVLQWVRWVNDEHLVFSVYYPDRRYGIATGETRLLSASRKGGDTRVMARPRSYDSDAMISQFQDRVVSFLPDDPEHILLALADEKIATPGVYRINVESGSRKRVQRYKTPIRTWVSDRQGRVRAGYGYDEGTAEVSLWVKPLAGDDWRQVTEQAFFAEAAVTPIGFARDPNLLYVRANHEGRKAVFRIDTADPGMPRELVFSHPEYDVDGPLVYSQLTNDVIGVQFARVASGMLFLDKGYEALQRSVDKALPDRANTIVSYSADETLYLVRSSSATVPPAYYLGNRKRGTLFPIAQEYPLLAEVPLSEVRQLHYPTRDGLKIEAYLALPASGPKQKLPTIIFPHGGPMARAGGGFDYWTQFFTSRGYAVLQPNFRGSAGFGHEFMAEAVQGYGLEMQDDLEDGARWLIGRGIADRGRICIVGASYGGYAALMGAVKTPDFYRCAISYAGVSSLIDMRFYQRNYLNRKVAEEQIGTERSRLRAVSPRYHADKIQVPVLLAHGDRDRVVPVAQSRDMADALEDADRDFIYMELEDGSHNLHRQQNRTALFEAMERFLGEHLAAGP